MKAALPVWGGNMMPVPLCLLFLYWCFFFLCSSCWKLEFLLVPISSPLLHLPVATKHTTLFHCLLSMDFSHISSFFIASNLNFSFALFCFLTLLHSLHSAHGGSLSALFCWFLSFYTRCYPEAPLSHVLRSDITNFTRKQEFLLKKSRWEKNGNFWPASKALWVQIVVFD